jgi:hypothetical protein
MVYITIDHLLIKIYCALYTTIGNTVIEMFCTVYTIIESIDIEMYCTVYTAIDNTAMECTLWCIPLYVNGIFTAVYTIQFRHGSHYH